MPTDTPDTDRAPMTVDEQTAAWVEGRSIHNTARDECCPDFSCCQPELLASPEVRRAFQLADERTRHRMLGGFLNAAISAHFTKQDRRENVYIAGVPEGEPS